MKFIVPLSALLLSSLAAFAESPSGFAEIPFGASAKEAKKALSARDGIKPETATGERLTFLGGTFGGHPVSRWTLTFAGDKFATGSVLVESVKKPTYDEMKAELTKKYGKPDSEKGHHSFESVWEFRSDGRRTVRLEYEYMGKIVLTYAHENLAKGAASKPKSDF